MSLTLEERQKRISEGLRLYWRRRKGESNMSNHNTTSPAVERAMKRFHEKLAAEKVNAAMKDDGLADQVRRVIDERDHLLHIAGEMLATILLPQNEKTMPVELRQIADVGWRPQLEAIAAGRQLTPEELSMALNVSGIDMEKGYARLRAAIEKAKAVQP